jgi:hypothetical protein
MSTQQTPLLTASPGEENFSVGTDGENDYDGEYDLKLPNNQLLAKLRKMNGGKKINQELLRSYGDSSSDMEHLNSLAANPESFQSDIVAFNAFVDMLDSKKILIAKDFNKELYIAGVDLTPSPNLNKNKEKIVQYLKYYKTFFKPPTEDEKKKPEISVTILINSAIKIKNPLMKSIALNNIFKQVKNQVNESE